MTDRRGWACRRAAAFLLGAFSISAAVPSVAYFAPTTQSPGIAPDPTDPYQATAIVTGVDMRNRPLGFARCLREVLVKVSGEPRLRNDQRLSALAAQADQFVLSFDYHDQMAGIPPHDDQGTYDRSYDLTVRFDPAKIDMALADLGEKPWLGERPVVVPVLAVHGPKGRYLLSAEGPVGSDQRDSLANAARQYGVRLRIPTQAEFAAWGFTVDESSTPRAELPIGEALVAGTLEFDEAAPGWIGSWRMRRKGVDYAWRISGVNFDEAFRDVIRGVVRLASGHDAPN
jgi:uncharacterized protein